MTDTTFGSGAAPMNERKGNHETNWLCDSRVR